MKNKVVNKFISTKNDTKKENVDFATVVVQILSFLIAMFLVIISKYAFIFFISAMLPTIVAMFFDRGDHKCASATICTFNLMGTMPYLFQMWTDAKSVNNIAKDIISSIDTWVTIYFTSFIGQMLYIMLPLLILKIYQAKAHVKAKQLIKIKEETEKLWGINNERSIQKSSIEDEIINEIIPVFDNNFNEKDIKEI